MIGKIKRWQWIALSILIGFTVPLIRGSFDGELYGFEVKGYGYRLTNQGRFEDALVREFEGRRQFKDITVYPVCTANGGREKRPVHLVSGLYYSGRPEPHDGQLVARWYPTCFVAKIPYRPRGIPPETDPRAIQRFEALAEPTVVDYLNIVKAGRGLTYRYAWWAAWPRLTWMVASVLLIGIVWPTFINLMLYGTFHRPVEERPVALPERRPSPAQTSASTAGGVDCCSEIDSQLDSVLPGTPDSEGDPKTQATPAAPTLAAESLEPAQAVPEGPAVEFGKKPEDYYPTEVRRGSARD